MGLFCNVLQPDLVVDRPPAQKISLLVKFLVTKVAYCNEKNVENKKVFQFDSLSKTFGFSCDVVIFVREADGPLEIEPDPITIVLLNKEPDPIKIILLNKEPDQIII